MATKLAIVPKKTANIFSFKSVEGQGDAYQALLAPLLEALHWKGDLRHVSQALPPQSEAMDLQQFRDMMVHLGYTSVLRFGPATQLSTDDYPVLWIDTKAQPHLLRNQNDAAKLKDHEVTLVMFMGVTATIKIENIATTGAVLQRYKSILAQVMLISLLVGFIALAPTIYNMALYDTVISAGSTQGMVMMLVGVVGALAAECILRRMRNKRLGYFGARLDHYISCSVFERLLFLPPVFTERASISSQLARLRDFEAVREFFTGPLATLFFELPLIAVYLAAMACLSGSLTFVPLALVGAYALLLWSMDGKLKESSRKSANAVSKRQEFLLETLTKLRAIRLAGWEKMWQARYHRLSNEASLASFRAGFQAQILETMSYVLMTLGGVATMGFGVMGVINQQITVGALIASMMLIWRIVAPMQLVCASATRLQQLASSTRQVQRLLGMAPEHDPSSPTLPVLNLKGQITFHRVLLRYSNEAEPALLGVSFNIRPGQVIAIKGDNGSGKSTILKLVLGLYTPQSGAVRLDGIDVRQFDPLDLRQSIAYVPQDMDLMPGTVRDNLLFANPLATEEQCYNALRLACAIEEIERLPQRLDTVIAGENAEGISFMLTQRLNLARAYLKPAAIILFDEASHSLGQENDLAFANMVAHLRGRCTVLLATHREDHMRMSDALLVMNKGELTHAGTPDQVLNALKKK
jgi:ATP-binding cassette subfamily C protein LapB